MRLSEAIGLGRTLIKPKPGTVGNLRQGCVLGMARVAGGVGISSHLTEAEKFQRLTTAWPFLNMDASCPCSCSTKPRRLVGVISHIFDKHVMGNKPTWTLDQLLDWIRSVEPEEVEVVAEPEEIVQEGPSNCL